MKISIVVPAYNEEKLISACLRSIRASAQAFSARGWDWECIVCDNNSSDRTGELARAEGVGVVFEPRNQIARARNRGASAASGHWLIFVDADSCPGEGLFGEVADEIARGRVLAGGSVIRLDKCHRAGEWVAFGWNCWSRLSRWLAGSFIFCEAAAFREIGGFNEEYFVAEELDLTRRLKALAKSRGKRVVILHRYPLVTSARKFYLYSAKEHLKFLAKIIFRRMRAVHDRSECTPWYDGRR